MPDVRLVDSLDAGPRAPREKVVVIPETCRRSWISKRVSYTATLTRRGALAQWVGTTTGGAMAAGDTVMEVMDKLGGVW